MGHILRKVKSPSTTRYDIQWNPTFQDGCQVSPPRIAQNSKIAVQAFRDTQHMAAPKSLFNTILAHLHMQQA